MNSDWSPDPKLLAAFQQQITLADPDERINGMTWQEILEAVSRGTPFGRRYYSQLVVSLLPFEEQARIVGERHGWDQDAAKRKISSVQDTCCLETREDAVVFLLESIPVTKS